MVLHCAFLVLGPYSFVFCFHPKKFAFSCRLCFIHSICIYNVFLSCALSMELLLPPDMTITDQINSFLEANIASNYGVN